MDDGIGFSASNRSIHVLGRRSNCSWGPVIAGLKNQRNWSRFNLYLHNHECYGKMDDGIGFSASNRSIHVLGRRSNCSWGVFITGLYKTAKSRPILIVYPQPEPLWQTRGQRWIQRINRSNYILGKRSNCSWGPVITGLKNSEIKADFDFISTTRAAMVKWTAELDSAHQIGLITYLEDVLTVVGGLSSLD